MYTKYDDLKSALNCLGHGYIYALKRNDMWVYVCFQLEKAQLLLKKHECAQFNNIMNSLDVLFDPPTASEIPKSINEPTLLPNTMIPQLKLWFILLRVVYLLHYGDRSKTPELLQTGYTLLNQWKQNADRNSHLISQKLQQLTTGLTSNSTSNANFGLDHMHVQGGMDGSWFQVDCTPIPNPINIRSDSTTGVK